MAEGVASAVFYSLTTATFTATPASLVMQSPVFDLRADSQSAARPEAVRQVEPRMFRLSAALTVAGGVTLSEAIVDPALMVLWGAARGVRTAGLTTAFESLYENGRATLSATDFELIRSWNMNDDLFLGQPSFGISDVPVATRFCVLTVSLFGASNSGGTLRFSAAGQANLEVWLRSS